MKTMKVIWISCSDCAIVNMHQPCEACTNYITQQRG